MKKSKLAKLRGELASARRGPRKARELEALARQLGRRIDDRGKEPVWVSDVFPGLRPLSIPHHGGRDLAPGTQRSILAQLEDDVIAWDEHLDGDEDDEDEG